MVLDKNRKKNLLICLAMGLGLLSLNRFIKEQKKNVNVDSILN